jgi:hypothetical protein
VASLLLKYLGLPLGASYKATFIWNGILEKMERCLAGWNMLYLSKGGRLTLIKKKKKKLFPICLVIICPFSPFLVGVADRIEKLQRDFLSGGSGHEFKFHFVIWSNIFFNAIWWFESKKSDLI